MQYYTTQEISELALLQLPIKYTDLTAKALQYHTIVFNELVTGYYLADMKQINNNTLPFNITRVRKALGRFGAGGRGYWWDWLHVNFPLVTIISKGNSIQGVSSMAELTGVPLDIILAGANGKELLAAVYGQYGDADIDITPIDQHSLANYISSTSRELAKKSNNTRANNLKSARIILAVARELNGYLYQVKSPSSFGRTYYKGVNLQNVHATVREAALGCCWSIDIDTSVFNWKYSVVPFRDELTYTRELIQCKNRIRRDLALVVFGNSEPYSIKTIKQVLTAIGFGAGSHGKAWFKTAQGAWTQGAVSELIRSADHRERLFADPWMQGFMKEQDRINKNIGSELALAAASGEISEVYLQDLRSERGRISKSKLIAWAYQQTEQTVMADILEHAGSAALLLQVHDGVYFKTKPDIASMQDVLRLHWPLATLSSNKLEAWRHIDHDELQAHRLHIQQEERNARELISLEV